MRLPLNYSIVLEPASKCEHQQIIIVVCRLGIKIKGHIERSEVNRRSKLCARPKRDNEQGGNRGYPGADLLDGGRMLRRIDYQIKDRAVINAIPGCAGIFRLGFC